MTYDNIISCGAVCMHVSITNQRHPGTRLMLCHSAAACQHVREPCSGVRCSEGSRVEFTQLCAKRPLNLIQHLRSRLANACYIKNPPPTKVSAATEPVTGKSPICPLIDDLPVQNNDFPASLARCLAGTTNQISIRSY